MAVREGFETVVGGSRTFPIVLEVALSAELKRQRETEWLAQNMEAIDAYNRHIERDGLWSDGLRLF
jgi:antitoxin CcdA